MNEDRLSLIEAVKNSQQNGVGEVFAKICDLTNNTLNATLDIIAGCYNIYSADLIDYFKYDYESLFVQTMSSLLNMISIDLSENASRNRMKNRLADELGDEGCIRKRLKRIAEEYSERNREHAKYLNAPHEFKPNILIEKGDYYQLLSEYPLLKRFLHKEEAIITKKFFDELNNVYDYIESEDRFKGYNKFRLYHWLETDSKLELFYKLLMKLKRLKAKKRLQQKAIDRFIKRIGDVHIVPMVNEEIMKVVDENGYGDLFMHLSGLEGQYTIGNVVFDLEDLIETWDEDIDNVDFIVEAIRILNFISFSVVSLLHLELSSDIQEIKKDESFKFFEEVINCEYAANFFQGYLANHLHIKRDKRCSEDITFDHFKTLYNLKKEPPRKNDSQ